jgi:hypothetical protein
MAEDLSHTLLTMTRKHLPLRRAIAFQLICGDHPWHIA